MLKNRISVLKNPNALMKLTEFSADVSRVSVVAFLHKKINSAC